MCIVDEEEPRAGVKGITARKWLYMFYVACMCVLFWGAYFLNSAKPLIFFLPFFFSFFFFFFFCFYLPESPAG